MIEPIHLAGSFTLPGASMTVNRMGYGAMQLAGPEVWGPPRDVDAAIAVLREAVESGVNHIDTSDYYGPHVTNQLIKKALHPYLDGLVIVTKVGARRGSDKSWLHALSRQELLDAVHDNTTFHPGNPRAKSSLTRSAKSKTCERMSGIRFIDFAFRSVFETSCSAFHSVLDQIRPHELNHSSVVVAVR